jgi:mxaJ protein
VVRKTLDAHECDVLAGVPVGMKGVATTSAYYRSGYVFVSRREWGAPIVSFDDPRLRNASVGVQLVGADTAATPAALALARRGIVANVTGFPVYGAQPDAQRMLDAIDHGQLDVVVAWGPQVGYFAARAKKPLVLGFAPDDGDQPMTFAIALGVREDDAALRDRLDRALVHARERIDRTLTEFNVPVMRTGLVAAKARP